MNRMSLPRYTGVDGLGLVIRGCACDGCTADLVNLGRESRMNIPGRPEGNWCWRCTEDMLSDPAFEWLRDLTKNSNRSGALLSPHTGKMLEVVSRT